MPPLNVRGVLSASIGLAPYVPERDANVPDEHDKSELLRRADSAMYRAKSQGKNRVVVAMPGEATDESPEGELSQGARKLAE